MSILRNESSDRSDRRVRRAERYFGEVGVLAEVGGADVLVVSVRWTVDEPSCFVVVVSLVSEVALFPESVVIVDCVRVVVVDLGGALLAHAAAPRVDAINSAVRVDRRERLVMLMHSCKQRPAPSGSRRVPCLVEIDSGRLWEAARRIVCGGPRGPYEQ
jgi:hypothetical protein